MKLTEDQYHRHLEEYDGYCRKCDDITRFGETEPDAQRYPCDQCEQKKVYGIDHALIAGWIEIVEVPWASEPSR